MPKIKDLTNNRYGHLTVLKMNEERGPHNKVMCTCRCDCGNEIVVMSNSLQQGKTVSCGCRMQMITHNMTGTRIYKIWAGIKNRCDNPNEPAYKDYGGRGITYCNEWKEFSSFYEWANESGYEDNLTIDRIDVDGNYEPVNCRWATCKEQNNNRRNNIYIEYDNEVITLKQLSEITDINYNTLLKRYNKGDRNESLVRKPKGDNKKNNGKKEKK